jgi:RNA polymerase sigma-70 factor (ECF subfamily)
MGEPLRGVRRAAGDQGWGAMTSILFSSPQATPEVTVASLDDHLIERMRQNDEHAYRLLVERHIDRAYGLALRILRRPADAEDVAQEAFVKAWINRDKWQTGRAKFSTWLYRVIVNRCIDLQRAPRNEWLDDAPEPVDEAEDSVTAIQRQQVYGRLEQAVERLPGQQRTAVLLSYYEDMSNAEIAEVMGISVSATEALLKRGRQRLREILKRSAVDVKRLLEDD